MRCCRRNMQTFWYALYNDTQVGYDSDNYENAAYPTYQNPVQIKGNISPAKGSVVARQFGDDDMYDKVIVIGDAGTPINEYAVLWLETEPTLDANGALETDANGNPVTPWDYVVRKVGRWLPEFGGAAIAVSKVTVS